MATVRSFLVTGSNQGLGMHTVHQLAATPEVLLFMGSRKLAAAEEALAKFASDIHPSSKVVPVQLDITDDASVKNAHAFIAKYLQENDLPGLDVLVNNAGIIGKTFEETFAVNVFGTARITDAIRPILNKGGAILNISSGLGSMSLYSQRPPVWPVTRSPFYGASKAALNSLTVQWALQEEQKGSGIRVVSICPGHNATNLNRYTGSKDPADGCKVIVKEALAKEGKTSVFIKQDGEWPW
ncbi:short-chain dehydrogenase/reductase SDR [Mycena galericulata]|nr:short-chain dehydrogenase/reductase SDR [Mycena galericulata]